MKEIRHLENLFERHDFNISTTERLEPRSVWNWNFQFSDRDISLFINPLYKFSQLRNCTFRENRGEKKLNSVLLPEPSLPCIELWMQCYFRWLPLLSIKSGGRPQVDIAHRQLLTEIESLLNDFRGNLKKSSGNSASSNNVRESNSNNAYKNSVSTNGSKENNYNYDLSVRGGSGNSSIIDNNDFSKLSLEDSNSTSFYSKEVENLFKNKDIIDNFFPFVFNNSPLSSTNLANSSNLSEFDTQSVLNLTD